jgi:hypothetical protein
VPLEFLWEQIVALLVYIVVIMVFAVRAFNQGLD